VLDLSAVSHRHDAVAFGLGIVEDNMTQFLGGGVDILDLGVIPPFLPCKPGNLLSTERVYIYYCMLNTSHKLSASWPPAARAAP
jgi:hypothetical protein